jgi:hypothetical protein
MKRIIFSYLVLTLAAACSVDTEKSLEQNLLGAWTWESSVGGFTGETKTHASTNSSIRLEFRPSSLETWIDGKLQSSDAYSIVSESIGPPTHTVLPMLRVKDKIDQIIIITQEDDRLVLRENCDDCYIHWYQRAK